jgi:light-regulated signal transduction histidine kinase (bacteriophytochrome)
LGTALGADPIGDACRAERSVRSFRDTSVGLTRQEDRLLVNLFQILNAWLEGMGLHVWGLILDVVDLCTRAITCVSTRLRGRSLDLQRQAERLVRENKELLRRNADLEEFTDLVSHDLQEPLRKLIGFSSMLEKDLGGDLPERAREDLQQIIDASRRMQMLVQNLLSLSRAAQQTWAPQAVSLDRCVDAALADLVTRIDETGAEITREDLPCVQGDPTLLTQVYQNLIVNALKFSRPGANPVVRLGAKQLNGHVVLSVEDNGIGIKSDHLKQIFTPFTRLHGRDEYEGSGIGLAICAKAVERHHGEIWVESKPGEGSTFSFTLLPDL